MVPQPRLLRYLGNCLLDFVYPPQCLACEGPLEPPGRILCGPCWAEIDRMPGAHCARCGSPSETMVEICAICRDWDSVLQHSCVLGRFEGGLRNAIYALKFNHRTELGRACGRRLGRRSQLGSILRPLDWLVPVPLHPARQRERGFNQSYHIALGLSDALDIPVRVDVVQRKTQTRQQANLDLQARHHNMEDAFVWKGKDRLTGSVGLVDDVITTGSTLASCARVLYANGADNVVGLALATAPRNGLS